MPQGPLQLLLHLQASDPSMLLLLTLRHWLLAGVRLVAKGARLLQQLVLEVALAGPWALQLLSLSPSRGLWLLGCCVIPRVLQVYSVWHIYNVLDIVFLRSTHRRLLSASARLVAHGRADKAHADSRIPGT